MSKNRDLNTAKRRKKDEFYTQLSDIERELKYYIDHFRGQMIYYNCDDPSASNFFQHFAENFEDYGLKKLIITCYKNQERDLFSKHDVEQALYLEYYGDQNKNNEIGHEEIAMKPLKGDGDFRSICNINR